MKGAYETLRHIPGAELLEEPGEAFWGGGFSGRDPEGNVWDVAWAKATTFDDRGGVRFPSGHPARRALGTVCLRFVTLPREGSQNANPHRS